MNLISQVIGYFSTRLQRVQEGAGGDLGVTEVLQCIKKGAGQWSSDRLKVTFFFLPFSHTKWGRYMFFIMLW
jgi:hypothetical protein